LIIRFRKAQVEAPIELFVAVIILAMSMALALSVWGNMQEQECVAKIKTTMSRVQNAMVSIAISSPPTTRIETIAFPRCGKYDVRAVQFAYFSKAEYCRLCPGHYGGCWQLIPLSYDAASGQYSSLTDAITCVQVSGQLRLAWDGDVVCAGGGSEGSFNHCPCPRNPGEGDACSSGDPLAPYEACRGKTLFVQDPAVARYYSLGRPQTGNSFVLRFRSVGVEVPATAKEIDVCAFTPDCWNKVNNGQTC
jgi:hypothetical protein